MGLCRKPPAIRASHTDPGNLPEPAFERDMGGGAGGSDTIRRGTGAALQGVRSLIHNPQLLWFPLFVALVLGGISIILGVLSAVSSSLEWRFFIDSYIEEWRFSVDPFITQWWPSFYPHNARLLYSLVMTFVTTIVVELVTVFCLAFLLAGLVLCLSSRKDGPVSFFHGIAMAGKHIRPITRWSGVMALAGTLLFIACQYSYLLNLSISQFLFNVLSQSPFNYIFTTNLGNIFPSGQFGFMGLHFFNIGLMDMLILSAVNVLLFVLTLFVIPLLVLERTSLKEAVVHSFSLMRKTWSDVAACIIGLGVVVCAALLMSLIFPSAAGGNIAVDYWPPPAEWLAAGILYVLTLIGLAFVVATVGGIAALNLYISAKTGQIPGSPESEPHS
jgi:hypothetical protein